MIKNLNFILILITIAILAAIGGVFIYGSAVSWVQSIKLAEWRQTIMYQNFVADMNLAVLPLSVILVVVLALCIPKRLFRGVTLLQSMVALLLLALAVGLFFGSRIGIGFLLATATLIQIVVIVMTLAGSKRLSYETQGFFVQIGSALLHLGLIIFLYDFVILARSSEHINIFWLATALISVGMIFCFYSGELSRKTALPIFSDQEKQTQSDK